MGTLEMVAVCGVLPTLWIWLLCLPGREMQAVKVQTKLRERRDWRDDLSWRQ